MFKDLLVEASIKAMEEKFLWGDCVSFATALKDAYGGEFYSLDRDGKPMHVYIKKNGKNYDVKGERSTGQIILSLAGSIDPEGWKVEGPYTADTVPCRKATPKSIETAKKFIEANKNRFKGLS